MFNVQCPMSNVQCSIVMLNVHSLFMFNVHVYVLRSGSREEVVFNCEQRLSCDDQLLSRELHI